MDIYCPRCGEPWEISHVYHEMTDQERGDLLAGRGCSTECRANPPRATELTAKSQVVLDLLGDDLDGAAAMMEDFSI